MNWEVVNGITGLVSAICAVLGIGYFGFHKSTTHTNENQPILKMDNLVSFVVACSGWALCCLSFLWVVEPFGCCPLPREYQQFFGVILAFPALVIFLFGLNLLQGKEHNKSSKKEAQKACTSS